MLQRLLKGGSVVENILYIIQIYVCTNTHEIYVDTWRGRGSLDVRKASQCRMSGRGLRFPKLSFLKSYFPQIFFCPKFYFPQIFSHLKSHFPKTFLSILTIWGQFCYLLLTLSKHGWIFFIIYHCGQSRSSNY